MVQTSSDFSHSILDNAFDVQKSQNQTEKQENLILYDFLSKYI